MRALAAVSLLGCLALWGWALYWPKEAPVLPDGHCGSFRVYRYEPGPTGPRTNPYPPGQKWTYTFHKDCTYTITIRIAGGYEMKRFQGTAVVDGDWLVLEQVSDDRKLAARPPWRARWEGGTDKEGAFVRLVDERGGQHFLRRASGPEAAAK